MSDDSETEFLNKITEELEIDINNIWHITIVGGVELVGEMFDIEDMTEDSNEFFDNVSTDYLFLNPIKVFRESWIDNEGYACQNYFIEWNPCIDGPYTYINPATVISMNKPNHETLTSYLNAVHDQYYPLLMSAVDGVGKIPEDQKLVIDDNLKGNNIIDFNKYLLLKLSGNI